MYRNAFLLTAGLIFAASAPDRIEAQGVDGNWKLTYLSGGGTRESTIVLVKLKTVEGKITGEVIDTSFTRRETSVAQEGDFLRVQATSGQRMVFETPVVKAPAKRWLGAMTIGKTVHPAWLTRTTETEMDRQDGRRTHICPPMQEAAALTKRALELSLPRFKGSGLSAAQKKQADEADEIAKKEAAPLYRKVLANFPDDPALFSAVLGLMRSAQTNKATLEDVKGWSATADKLAKAYGPRFEIGFAVQAAAALEGQDAYATIAVDYARRVERTLTAKTPAQEQIEVLEPLGRALRKAGQGDEAKLVEARVAKIEAQLDRDYLATLPAVKPFAGRKSKSDRVVILEQFTHFGSGSGRDEIDRACSLLLKTYKPSELVLVQYGTYGYYAASDGGVLTVGPLGNRDAQARYAYFRKAFPEEVRNWSVSLFNGFPKGRGDGQRDEQRTYKAFREIIDPMLEEDARVTLAAKAVRKGDKIDIEIDVSNLKNPDPDMKLRIMLAEETVRYPSPRYSGKGLARLHNNIVRASPGGVAGKPLTKAASKHAVSINLEQVRGELVRQLENAKDDFGRYLKNPPPASLLKLEHLRIIAFVQDDNTREILQAVQVDVK